MSYEWDLHKAESNFYKHGVHFADAVAVFEDENALWQEDDGDYDEPRLVAVGLDHRAAVLPVIFTFRGENIRLISARKATNLEKKTYERKKQ